MRVYFALAFGVLFLRVSLCVSLLGALFSLVCVISRVVQHDYCLLFGVGSLCVCVCVSARIVILCVF